MFSKLNNKEDTYIIAEVGQNHQGSLEEALKYIDIFSSLGANAVKFQMRSNKSLFHESIYSMKYESDNSFGDTYGKHREFLELTFEDFKKLFKCCKKNKVDFIVTPFDLESLEKCIVLKVDVLKIASFDLGNLPLINDFSKSKIPIILSTGGGEISQISDSIKIIQKYHNDFAILHCVSHYPCPLDKVNLGKINIIKELYPNITVGLSDHFNGILTGPLAYINGARVFEKHVTFNRSNKGTDHPFSLEPDGFRKFVRDIHRTPIMMSSQIDKDIGKEPVFKKLGKSLIANKFIKAGHIINIDDLDGMIIRPQIIPVRESSNVIGRRTKIDINQGTFINYENLEK